MDTSNTLSASTATATTRVPSLGCVTRRTDNVFARRVTGAPDATSASLDSTATLTADPAAAASTAATRWSARRPDGAAARATLLGAPATSAALDTSNTPTALVGTLFYLNQTFDRIWP